MGPIETLEILDSWRSGRRWLARVLNVGFIETLEILDSWWSGRRWLGWRLRALVAELWAL